VIRRLLPLLLVGVIALAGCGSSHSSTPAGSAGGNPAPAVHFAKTKFLLHAGLAFGVFHRYIYKPFKAGTLSHPLLHKLTFLKAAAAALFVIHEVKLARTDAQASKLLSKVILPLTAVGSAVALARLALLKGKAPAGPVNYANSSAAAASAASSAAGQPITETTTGSGL
jgi:hypothetical protein